MQPLYGVVLYDFQAERSDELDAKAGEPIIVIAQSNEEWFVAKPIGRLGGPGLIPVSFVEIRDAVTGQPITNINDLMQASATPILPRVEEWKKMAQGYEASSISLNSLEKQQMPQQHLVRSGFSASSSSSASSATSSRAPKQHLPEDMYDHSHVPRENHPDAILDSHGMQHLAQSKDLSDTTHRKTHISSIYDRSPRSTARSDRPVVEDATIDSFILEGDQYWFIVYARLSNGRHRVLYRLYDGKWRMGLITDVRILTFWNRLLRLSDQFIEPVSGRSW